jgi:hypothetical protein
MKKDPLFTRQKGVLSPEKIINMMAPHKSLLSYVKMMEKFGLLELETPEGYKIKRDPKLITAQSMVSLTKKVAKTAKEIRQEIVAEMGNPELTFKSSLDQRLDNDLGYELWQAGGTPTRNV